MRRVGLGRVLLAAALLAYVLLRGDNEVSAEEKYDGVHLCSPSQQEATGPAAVLLGLLTAVAVLFGLKAVRARA